MRRQASRFSRATSLLLGAAVIALTTVATIGGAGAAFAADPTTPPPAGDATNPNLGPKTAGTAVCTLQSSTLSLITGMISTAAGTMVVDAAEATSLKLWTLDAACKATAKTFATDPRDPEDMAIQTDGTIWVADIGDKDGTRKSIAVHRIAPNASTATTSRMAYTDGAKDAAAFLLDGDDKPIIFANAGQPGATLYKPNKELVPNTQDNLPQLAKVGVFTPEKTGTSNPTSESQVTGAAKSPDGKKVVIRTLADAYEYDVPDGDVIKAITTTKPRITPLPDEPQGEAIAYTPDGAKFVTIGFKPTGATENAKLRSYAPFAPAPAADPGAGAGDPGAPSTSSERSWLSKVTPAQLTRLVAAVGVVGLVLAIAGIVGIRRARKRRREEEDDYDDEYDDYDERPRRGRGDPRARDEQGGYGPRDPQYDDQYGASGYADAGYGAANGYGANGYPPANGYGANGYADPAYGQPAAANGYGQEQQYGAEAYGQYEGQYGPQEYGGQAGYDGYGQQQYGAEQYGAEQYGGQQYADQQYADPYAAPDPYGAPAPQQYDPGQQYGGYGYDEYDQSQDPRRR